MNLKELRGRIKVIEPELSTLAKKDERTADEESKLDQLMEEFNDLYPQVERLAAVEDARGKMQQLGQSRGRVSGIHTQESDEELENTEEREAEFRSIGEQFANSDEIKEFLASGGRQSGKVTINRPSARNRYAGDGPMDRLALITTGTPQYLVPPDVVPDIKRPRDYALTMREVLVSGQTESDSIIFVRELAFTNAAAETAQATSFDPTALGSSGRKPQSSLTFEQASATVKTIAHWLPITRQAIADAKQLQTYAENRLDVGLDRRVNSQIVVGDGTGENLLGLMNTDDVQIADDDYFTTVGNEVQNAGTQLEDFERILRAATNIELVGDAQATFVALNPRDIERLITVANDDHEYLGSSPFAQSAARTVWSYPIARDRAVPEGQFIVGDGTMAAYWDRQQNTIMIDTINDQFIRNMLTILAECRGALTVFRPSAFVIGDFAA